MSQAFDNIEVKEIEKQAIQRVVDQLVEYVNVLLNEIRVLENRIKVLES